MDEVEEVMNDGEVMLGILKIIVQLKKVRDQDKDRGRALAVTITELEKAYAYFYTWAAKTSPD